MNDKLTVTINNMELPVKEYRGQRVITLKEIDTVHSRPDGTARRNFNANRNHLIEDTDFFQVCADEIRTHNILGISSKTHKTITLITESGYLMLVKSFTDDLAWTVQRQLVNVYFRATDDQRKDAAKQTVQQKTVDNGGKSAQKSPSLSAVTAAMKLQIGVAKEAGISPEFIQLALSKAYEPYGIAIPSDCLPETEKLYECEAIATELGVMSEKGKPHNKAVAAIIKIVGADENEVKTRPFSTNSYSNVTVKYKHSVLEKVCGWLEVNNYPASFQGTDGKNYRVKYREENRV